MYNRILWSEYDYNELFKPKAIDKKYNPKTKKITKFSQFIIMVDTETCKSAPNSWHYDNHGSKKYDSVDNFVCAFSISIRWRHENIVTLYGNNPHDCADCIERIIDNVYGDRVFLFIFNLSYDWVFLKKFLINRFGDPVNQLNLDNHQPISIEFGKLCLRDALALAQRRLEKWANDLEVDHRKAVGKWDYDRTDRSQFDHFTEDELDYIECDTLAGVECIDAYLSAMNIKLKDIPYTATGIARAGAYKIARKNKAKETFKRLALKSLDQYDKFVSGFHGGYTHTNRYYADVIVRKKGRKKGKCMDISSSYPTTACCEKFPMSPFIHLNGYFTIDEILRTRHKYAYFFKITYVGVQLRDEMCPMPVMQWDKNIADISEDDVQIDNGRVLSAPIFEAYMTDVDLVLHHRQYTAKYAIISDVFRSEYGYLPRWFTDHVYDLYRQKCELKNGDKVLYDITKMRLNSVAYGMLAMRNVKEMIKEDYDTGEYYVEIKDRADLYQKFIDNRKSVYPYQWSLWITAWSQYHLFELGACCTTWLYSDTDSCFSFDWDMDKVKQYNKNIEDKLRANGYEPVKVNGKIYHLGAAEVDKEFDKFKALHSKCYAYVNDGQLYATIAGVPKSKGAECLGSLKNFHEGFVFTGEKTGKLTHIYRHVPKLYNKDGNIYGDSIDLIPCDYKISRSRIDQIVDYDDDAIRDIVEQIFVDKTYRRINVYE